MRLTRIGLAAMLIVGVFTACDCDDTKSTPCDCVPVLAISQPGATVLTEFHDTNATELGVQYPVTVQTTCMPAGAELTFTNDQSPGEEVTMGVVLDDEITQTGRVEFGEQTFSEGTNRICIRGVIKVDRMAADPSASCSPAEKTVERCQDVTVQLGVPACRFEVPADGARLTEADDNPAVDGFQHDVQVACKGVNDGTIVSLAVNDRPPLEQELASALARWDDVDLAEGVNQLRAETTGAGGEDVAAGISVTVDTGGCAVRLLPPDGTVLRADDDEDPETDGLQVTMTVESDDAGSFACANGSEVTLHAGTDSYTGTLSAAAASFEATLPGGTVEAWAEVVEPGGRRGRSLTNAYFVCADPVEVAITQPRDGTLITDAADRDPDQAGIQVAVEGTSSGVPTAGNLVLVKDGEVVMEGDEPLRPVTFFPGAEYRFEWIGFSLSGEHAISVRGEDACGQAGQADIGVEVQTEQRTCVVTDPLNGAVLLAADDKDADGTNDLQYDVHVVTENVADGATYTLFIGGQSPVGDLVVQDGASINEITFEDGERTLQCVLDTGESSPVTTITVDGHAPTIEILDPSEGEVFDVTDIVVELLTTGLEDGVNAEVLVENDYQHNTFACTVVDNTARCPVSLFAESNLTVENTITASVSDEAGNPAAPDVVTVSVLVTSAPPVVAFTAPDETAEQPIVIAEADRLYDVEITVQNLAVGRPVELTVIDNGHAREPRIQPLGAGGAVSFADVVLPRGEVELRASATNAIGTGMSGVQLEVGDTTLPLVVITDPADGHHTPLSGLDVTVEADVEEGQVCHLCTRATPAQPDVPAACQAADAAVSGQVASSGQVVLGLTLTEGDHQIWASCENLAGQVGTSAPNHVVVDQTDPTVAIDYPANGQVFNADSPDRSGAVGFQIQVRLTADVEDGQSAELWVDSNPAEIIDNPVPVFMDGELHYSAVTVPDQARPIIDARVCDKAGNCADATPAVITVDRLAPDCTITDPQDLAELADIDDSSLADGFQYNVEATLSGAAEGDALCLRRKVNAGAWSTIACHDLAPGELNQYVFPNAILLPPGVDNGTVQLEATIEDEAQNTDNDQVTVTIDRRAPTVEITRPSGGEELGISGDLCSPAGFQTQVNIFTQYTTIGDPLVLCVSPDQGQAQGICPAGFGEVWNGSVSGTTSIISCGPMEQGTNELRAYAENIPGQGTMSDPVTVTVDSIPPTVETLVVDSDADGNGCLSQAEANVLQATVTISDQGQGVEGRTARLIQNWPSGGQLATSTIASGAAVFSVPLADGTYDLTVTATDLFNNPNIKEANPVIDDPEAQFTISVDTTPPSLAINSPAAGTLNATDDLDSGTQDLDFNFCASTNAEDGRQVSFSIDGTPVGTAAVSGGSACIQATMGQNTHDLEVSIQDACGNPATDSIQVTVDTILPTITCSAPSDNDTFNQQSVSFTCTTTGTDATQNIRVSSTEGGDRCSAPVDASGTTTFNCTLLEGTQDLTVTVRDPAGNVSDPDTITNVTIDITGCDIAFVGHSGIEIFNAADDKDGDPSNDLQIDLTAHSSSCTSASCPDCEVTLLLNGTPTGSAQALDASGNVTFTNVGFLDSETGTDVEVQIDDGAGNVTSDAFTVELVDLYPPTLVRDQPGGDDFDCVASTGNPLVDGSIVIADKIAGAPCDIDFGFTITDGGDATYPGTLVLREGITTLAGPTNITSASQAVNYTNVQLSHNRVLNLVARATDYAGNIAEISMTAEVDVVPPGAITDTAPVLANSRHADVYLDWTAVGEDETTGTATAYAMRWARTAIADETGWQNAIEISNSVAPGAPGANESFTAQWLPPLNTYHFAIRAVDEIGNHGPIPSDVSLSNMWNHHSYELGQSGGYFAFDLWNCGDIDHDGYADLAVGADTLNSNQGSLFVFYGRDDLSQWNDTDAPPLELQGDIVGEKFGGDVGAIGNLNGTESCDGDSAAEIHDIAVGSRTYDNATGKVSIFFGRCAAPLAVAPDVTITGNAQSSFFGYTVDFIGDVNGDGLEDLAISAILEYLPAPIDDYIGTVFVFFGRTDWSGVSSAADADIIIHGNPTDTWAPDPAYKNDYFGYRSGITTLGDIDGDGFGDFAVGASAINSEYLFDGAQMLGLTEAGWVGDDALMEMTQGDQVYSDGSGFYVGFGNRASGGIDFTGDGRLDLAVAAARYNRVHIFQGVDGVTGEPDVVIDPTPVYTLQIPAPSSWFGWDLDVGDVNMDGNPDLLMGTNTSSGHRAFIFINNGVEPWFDSEPSVTLQGTDYFGISTAVGDFNDDSLPDVVVGSNQGNGVFHVRY